MVALLEVLDDRGFDLLLESDGTGWPTGDIAARLVGQGRVDEALDWIAESDGPTAVVYAGGRLVELAGETLSATTRERLCDLVAQAVAAIDVEHLEETMGTVAVAAGILDPTRRAAVLDRAWVTLNDADDDDLYWDSLYEERDPRLTLAEAMAVAGQCERAEALFARAADTPYPFTTNPGTRPGVEHIEVRCRCGWDATELIARHDPTSLAVQLAIAEGQLDRRGMLRAIEKADRTQTKLLRDTTKVADAVVQRAAAERLWTIVRDCIATAHDDYAAAHPLYQFGLEGLGGAGHLLTESSRVEALEVVWGALGDRLPNPVTHWHVRSALIGLLGACTGDNPTAGRVRRELLHQVISIPEVSPSNRRVATVVAPPCSGYSS